MNYNQNHKIAQITPKTLVIGIDIAKHHHVARAQDYRGKEIGSTCFFDNTQEGFKTLLIGLIKKSHTKWDLSLLGWSLQVIINN
ncbi:IS110 family transposase [Niallia taxi]|uniref:IS110 family transposase n=1 Tax=Niallia taxi TaxID=2499688 RepID=UPI00399C7C07